MKTTPEMKKDIIEKISALNSKAFLFYILVLVDTLIKTDKVGAEL